jgi:hypothetical protein
MSIVNGVVYQMLEESKGERTKSIALEKEEEEERFSRDYKASHRYYQNWVFTVWGGQCLHSRWKLQSEKGHRGVK